MSYKEKRHNWGADMIIERLWVGGIQSSMDADAIKEHSITHIINCSHELPCRFPDQFEYLHIKLYDQTHQNIISIFPHAISFINNAYENNGSVLIHCANGSSRSGSIAIAFLLSKNLDKKEKTQGILSETLAFVQAKRPKIQPNPGFLEQLQLFETWGCSLPSKFNPEQQQQLKFYRLKAKIAFI
jgi:predicted protein tyrosine phosphatase